MSRIDELFEEHVKAQGNPALDESPEVFDAYCAAYARAIEDAAALMDEWERGRRHGAAIRALAPKDENHD